MNTILLQDYRLYINPALKAWVRAMVSWMKDSVQVPYIHVDTTVAGVELPAEALVGKTEVVLDVSMGGASNMHFADEEMSFVADFSRKGAEGFSFNVHIPYDAIRAISCKGSTSMFRSPSPRFQDVELQERSGTMPEPEPKPSAEVVYLKDRVKKQ